MKRKRQTKESNLQYQLSTCTKHNDLTTAISLYESALSDNLNLSSSHFNSILHLCSSPHILNSSEKSLALDYGFRVFDRIRSSKVPLTEATVTQLARLAVAKGEPEKGFELVKEMKGCGLCPKLRTYSSVLVCFCDYGRESEAYEVEEDMRGSGVELDEVELGALLKVSVEKGREERVYEYLHKLRGVVRGVSEGVCGVVERWFLSDKAAEVGVEEWDVDKVREERGKKGGGWHGMGWLGRGKWEAKRVGVEDNGVCIGCGEKLVCVDIDDGETERFASSIAGLAEQREAKNNFKCFMEWLEKHSDYEAILDGANIGYYQQRGEFSISQLDDVVKELYNRNKKWPLVVLHTNRLHQLRRNPDSKKVLDEWSARDALYATPGKSNDDWYWLYAAVKLKCLVVTNDEMRDHIFELLGSNFFLQWKERHQVHYTSVHGIPQLVMPPSYSNLIQESERGSWHVPVASESSNDRSRSWLCITRSSSTCHMNSSNTISDPLVPPFSNGSVSVKDKREEKDPSPHKQQ